MRVFMLAKERFVFHLRLEEVVEGLRTSGTLELPDTPEPQMEYALALLCEWGNLETCQDTTPAGSVEDFVKPRHTFQLTGPGEAAERALEAFDAASGAEAGLEST